MTREQSDAFIAAFKSVYHRPPAWADDKATWILANKRVKQFSYDEILAAYHAFLKDKSSPIAKGHSLRVLLSAAVLDRYLGARLPPKQEPNYDTESGMRHASKVMAGAPQLKRARLLDKIQSAKDWIAKRGSYMKFEEIKRLKDKIAEMEKELGAME